MKNPSVSIIIAVVVIGAIVLSGQGKKSSSTAGIEISNNVKIIDGKQVITSNAKGGYSPKLTTARAGKPTTIKMVTNGAFDCSTSLVILSLDYRKNLPQTGEVEIPVPSQESGTKLRGLCSMGMYNFEVRFN